jgi:hypothetical protein
VVRPDAVDHDAGRQRVLGVGDRLGQLLAAAALGERLAGRAGQHFEELPGHRRAAVGLIAAQEHDRVHGLGQVVQDHRPRRRDL